MNGQTAESERGGLGNDRIKALFQFLREYASLRYKAIKNVKEYERVFELDSPVFEEDEWVKTNYGSADPDAPILLVKKPSFSRCPKPDASFIEWLADGWDDYNKGISLRFPNARNYVDDVEAEFSRNYTRESDYESWVKRREVWALAQRGAESVSKLFADLFGVHSSLSREAESLEFVAASMFLTVPGDDSVDLPLLTKSLRIEFDPASNSIALYDVDVPPRLSSEVFPQLSNVNLSVVQGAEHELADTYCHPLDAEVASDFIGRLIHGLTPHSQLIKGDDQVLPDTTIVVRPKYSLALRKRPSGVVGAINRVLGVLESDAPVPAHLLELTGIEADGGSALDDEESESLESKLCAIDGEAPDILLSLPANHEQLEIARRIERSNAVLVQGPPGTGKTHTIANLMGHFLAEGKSVLVSSQTSKALSVVKDKLPDEIKPLCVSAADGSYADMERSIDAIVERQSSVSLAKLRRSIDSLKTQRESVLSELAKARLEIYRSRDREHEKVQLSDGDAFPIEAAEFIAAHAPECEGVVPGAVEPGTPLPLSSDDLSRLYLTNDSLSVEEEEALSVFGDSSSLAEFPSPAKFERLVAECERVDLQLAEVCEKKGWSVDGPTSSKIVTTDFCTIELPLKGDTGALEDASRLISGLGLSDSPEPWQIAELSDAMRGETASVPWQKLCESIGSLCSAVDAYRADAYGHEVDLGGRVDFDAICEEADELEHSLQRGRFASALASLFGSSDNSLMSGVTVDKHEPKSLEDAKLVKKAARLEGYKRACSVGWDDLMGRYGLPSFSELDADAPWRVAADYVARVRALLGLRESTSMLAGLLRRAGAQEECASSVETLVAEGKRADAVLGRLCSVSALVAIAMDYGLAERNRNEILGVEELVRSLAPQSGLSRCVEMRDADGYSRAYDAASGAISKCEIWKLRKSLLKKIEGVAPAWALAIRQHKGVNGYSTPPANLETAWHFAQCKTMLSSVDASELTGQPKIATLSSSYRRITSQLVAEESWLHLLERTQADHRLNQALNGWRQTVKRIGKGTGKKANEFRAKARQLMGQCQAAVPAWVMPMDYALGSLDPLQNHFDVLIVDEASQSDITALSLLFYADKVIIVGDDKQVSPLAIGIDNQAAQTSISAHIEGVIPNDHLYRPGTSLYDLAATTFRPLMLREHFRCAPDIIGFSNRLSYDFKIKPLRSSNSTNLLPAIVEERVEGGRRSSTGKQNREEAERTVQIIQACLDQPEYSDKTFGVISLLGKEQGNLVHSLLYNALGPAVMDKHRILCGDAAGFQGDERDVIILNLIDSNDGSGPLRLRSDGSQESIKKRYNVAVSRAKDQLWIVHSLDTERDLKPGDLRLELIRYARDPKALSRVREEVKAKSDSPFEEEVATGLRMAGYQIVQQYEGGSYRIDIALVQGAKRIAIECDGERWHSGEEKLLADMERQTILERLGWQFIRLRGSRYYANKQSAMSWLIHELECRDVKAEAATPEPVATSDLLKRVRACYGERKEAVSPAREPAAAPAPYVRSGEHPQQVLRDTPRSDSFRASHARESAMEEALSGRAERAATRAQERASWSGLGPHANAARPVPSSAPNEPPKPASAIGDEQPLLDFSLESPEERQYVVAKIPLSYVDYREYGDGQNRHRIAAKLWNVVECEGPIDRELLVAKVRASFGIQRSGQDIKNITLSELRGLDLTETRFNGHLFVWPNSAEPSTWHSYRPLDEDAEDPARTIVQIAPQELVACARKELTLFWSRGLEEQELKRRVAKTMGFKRTGSTIDGTIGLAINEAIRAGLLTRGSDGRIRPK